MFGILFSLVLTVGLLSGCGGTEKPPAEPPNAGGKEPAATAFKIGGTGPLTGGAAIYGNAAKNGAQIAVEEINALGGIQFELKYEDDEHGSPSLSVPDVSPSIFG